MERREFIGVATRATVGVAFGGAAVLAGCTDDAPDVASRTSTAGTTGTTSTTGTTRTTGSGPVVRDATVYRLSTRAQKAPCAACRAHAAHRHFATAEAADAGRAHPGCDCAIHEQPVASSQLEQWFAAGRDVYDDRWTT